MCSERKKEKTWIEKTEKEKTENFKRKIEKKLEKKGRKTKSKKKIWKEKKIIIIIIMSQPQHGYPWPSVATPPYRPLLPAGPQYYIPYRHRAAVCRFKMVVLPLLVHVKGVNRSTSLMCSSVHLQRWPVCLVRLILMVFMMGGQWSLQLPLCGVLPPGLVPYCSQHSCVVCRQAFSPYI